MRILLNQAEMQTAIAAYVSGRMKNPEDFTFDVTMHATRGELGWTSSIDVFENGTTRPVYEDTEVEVETAVEAAEQPEDADFTEVEEAPETAPVVEELSPQQRAARTRAANKAAAAAVEPAATEESTETAEETVVEETPASEAVIEQKPAKLNMFGKRTAAIVEPETVVEEAEEQTDEQIVDAQLDAAIANDPEPEAAPAAEAEEDIPPPPPTRSLLFGRKIG